MRLIQKHAKGFFGIYCVLMLWLLYGQRMGEGVYSSVNFIPFKTIGSYVTVLMKTSNTAMIRHIVINLVGNVIMFIPLGFFLPMIWHRLRSFPRQLLCSAMVIASIELVQYFTSLGSMDIDDLILNLPGSVIGYALWFMIGKEKNDTF